MLRAHPAVTPRVLRHIIYTAWKLKWRQTEGVWETQQLKWLYSSSVIVISELLLCVEVNLNHSIKALLYILMESVITTVTTDPDRWQTKMLRV